MFALLARLPFRHSAVCTFDDFPPITLLYSLLNQQVAIFIALLLL